MTQEEAVMKRLTAEELAELERLATAGLPTYALEARAMFYCEAKPEVVLRLLAMASRLVELESVMEYLYREDSRYPRSADELLSFGASLGWTSPTQKPNDGGCDA